MRFVGVLGLSVITACGTGKIELSDTGIPSDDTGVSGRDCPAMEFSDATLAWTGSAAGTPAYQTVTLTNFCTSGEDLEVFSVVGDTAFFLEEDTVLVPPGESLDLVIAFNPSDYDLHESELSMTTNEKGSPSYSVSLSGRAQPDMDGDGYEAVATGGDDCDDANPEAYPGAEEVWYDGVDQDCDGASDYDQDGDGFDHDGFGGTDCDDENADVNPETTEVWYDGVDQDCDGLSDYDQDQDGYDSEAHDGDDCDDQDALINPGVTDKWYDGVDADCAGNSDFDQDGDGGDAATYGGDDCDDFDASVYYDSGEVAQDGYDDDCDTLVDEDYLTEGDIIVSELMVNPDEVSDSDGEWLEVYNTSQTDIDLIGWTLSGSDGDSVTIADRTVVSAGGYAVLGTNSDSSQNGGAPVNAAYAYGSFKLTNDRDDLALSAGGLSVFSMAYDKSDIDMKKGVSINLDPAYLEQVYAEDIGYWCSSSSVFGDGDSGTPGSENDGCWDNDFDGDGFSRNDGDCDESDVSINPDATETWDGIDNDCDEMTDNIYVADEAVGYVNGQYGDYLGYWQGLALGDLDGSGSLDIVTGGVFTQDYYYDGNFHVIDGSAYNGYAGAASDNDYAFIEGASYYNYMSYLPSELGDQDGDGIHDLFVVASDNLYANYGNYAGGVFFGSTNFYGNYGIGDADVLFTGASSYQLQHTALSQFDVDGDGLDEVFYADFGDNSYAGILYGMQGAALTSGSTYSWPTDADYRWEAADKGDQLGNGLGGGDVDSDGYDDLLVSAPYGDQGTSDSGSVYLILGGGTSSADSDPERDADVIFYGDDSKDYLGLYSTSVVGDFDEDGNADVVIASMEQNEVYFFSDATQLSGKVNTSSADATIQGDGPSAFGLTLAVGDVDGDGYDDLVVGAPDYTGVYYAAYYADEPGAVYVFTEDLSTYGSSSDADAHFLGASVSDTFGMSLTVGDISGDGKDDIIAAAPAEWSSYGRVWILEAP